jgi:hypothetical protein
MEGKPEWPRRDEMDRTIANDTLTDAVVEIVAAKASKSSMKPQLLRERLQTIQS